MGMEKSRGLARKTLIKKAQHKADDLLEGILQRNRNGTFLGLRKRERVNEHNSLMRKRAGRAKTEEGSHLFPDKVKSKPTGTDKGKTEMTQPTCLEARMKDRSRGDRKAGSREDRKAGAHSIRERGLCKHRQGRDPISSKEVLLASECRYFIKHSIKENFKNGS